jgi:hypothetical protein
MKIRILKYHRHRGGMIKVQSHNKRKGKWKIKLYKRGKKKFKFGEKEWTKRVFYAKLI